MGSAPDDAPEKFFKYRPMNDVLMVKRVADIVLRNVIFFASPIHFNDPFDLRPALSLSAMPDRQKSEFVRLSRKFQPDLSEDEHLRQADETMKKALSPENIGDTTMLIQAMQAEALNQVGVFCVSTKSNDILMWSHYADSHRGVCLEFDGLSHLMAHAQQVIYSGERIPINPYEDDSTEMMEKAMLTKAAQWKYEAEWRLLNYKKGPGTVAFRPENLTGIFIGAHASAETIATVRKWQRERGAPLAIYQARFSKDHYALEIHRA